MSKQILVVAGPSGSGKNAVIEEVEKRFPNSTRLVSATTRVMRPGEVDGEDYYFFTQERFDQEVSLGNIPEHRYVPALNTSYGIYLPDLKKRLATGKIVFAQVDIEGARYLHDNFNATTVFIMPESLEQFRGRLRTRNPEWTEKEFEARMKITAEEMRVHAPQYDYRVVNADGRLYDTVEQVVDIMTKEGYNLR